MQEPKYRPLQWVIVSNGVNTWITQINGGRLVTNEWSYKADFNGTDTSVKESEITHTLENDGKWHSVNEGISGRS